MCDELYNGQFDDSHDWLDSLMKDEIDDCSSLAEDCMLTSGIGSSLELQQSPSVNSEHSYSLAAEYSHLAPVGKTELDGCMYCIAFGSLCLYIKCVLC